MALINVLDSCGHKISGWLHLYKSNLVFGSTYQTLLEGNQVPNFHVQDALLCHLGNICVPSRESAKIILEAHYSLVVGHFGVEKTMWVLQKYFYWPNLRQDVGRYIKSYSSFVIAKPTIKRKGLYTPLPICSRPWESISMDYMSSLPSTKSTKMVVFSWPSIDSLRWPLWQLAWRISQQKPLLSSPWVRMVILWDPKVHYLVSR